MSAARRPWVDAQQWSEEHGPKRREADRMLVHVLETGRMLDARRAAKRFLGSMKIPSKAAREKVLGQLTRQQALAWAELS